MLICCDRCEWISVDSPFKTLPFLLRRRLLTSAEYMSTVCAQIPVIFLFLIRSSKEFEEKSSSSKTFRFFSNKLWLYLRISSGFSSFISTLRNSGCNSSVKTISISADNGFSPLKRFIFRRRNMFLSWNVNKYENMLYTHKYD